LLRIYVGGIVSTYTENYIYSYSYVYDMIINELVRSFLIFWS